MSTHQRPMPMTVHGGDVRAAGPRSGWVAFACAMLGINGLLNTVYGIAAIDDANFYVHDAKYVLSDLNAFGWILLVTGVLQIAAVVSITGGTSWGRWFGIAMAGANAIGQLLFIPSAPFLSLALFAVDVMVIFGLAARWRTA